MAQYKLFGKDLKEYDDIDIDDLLSKLTPEEIEELGQELIDPDDSHIPPNQRCRYKTDKEPTGPFNRKKLMDFLEDKAKNEKDWDENKPYVKEIRGKVWKRKEEKIQLDDDESVATEWDEVLANATEEELVDLAAILGFHGMLNQVQYHKAFVEGGNDDDDDAEGENGEKKPKKLGFQGVAKHEGFKLVPDSLPNTTNVEKCLKQLQDNDPELKEINLNNIKNITLSTLCKFGDALAENTQLEILNMANVRATDRVAKSIAYGLKVNKTLKCLNVESNYVSGEGIKAILEALLGPQTLTELRLANQRPATLGVQTEQRIADLVSDNYTLVKFGIFLNVISARVQLQEAIKRNNDVIRVVRTGGEVPARQPLRCVEDKPSRRKQREADEAAAKAATAQNGDATAESAEEEESDEE